MSKLINELIIVHPAKGIMISAFIWRKRLYRVLEPIGWWREPVKWWDGEDISLYLRVNAKHSSIGTYELNRVGQEWFMYRVLD